MAILQTGTKKILLLAGTAILAITGVSSAAMAEETTSAAVEDQSTDEITVTAQRRTQSTMDVGINVSQISAERLANERVVTLVDLQQVTANVEVRTARPGGLGVITIRGVGMNDFTAASNPSTSVYFDGIYSPNVGTIGQQFFDLQSVEVLKGPQSTLYGRNATAGAVTVSSAEPTDELSGYATLGYGNYKAVDAEGAISGRIAEGLTARLSVKTRQQYDGFIKNLYPGGSDFGNVHQTSVRAQLKWDASERLTIRGIFGYQHENDDPGVITSFGRRLPGGTPTATTGLCAVALSNQIDYNNNCASLFGAQRTSTDLRTISENDSWNVKGNTYIGTVIAKYEADGFAVTSTTGYLNWYELYNQSDSLPITEYISSKVQKTWQVSEDIQIASTGTRKLDWMAGIYLSSANTSLPTYVIAPILPGSYIGTHDADTRTAQAYVQFDYHVTPQITLSAGARFLHEFDSKVGGTWRDVNTNRIVDAGDVQQAFLSDSLTQDALTWKFGVNYKPTSQTLIYGSVTHGFKSGGYIAPAVATNSVQLKSYKGEDIYAFELGIKQNILGDTIHLEAAAFYYIYNNLQTNTQTLVGNGNINVFANVPKANVKGLDLKLVLKPVEGLELRFDGGFLDTHVGTFTSGGITYAPGNRFANAPKFSGSSSIRYEVPITSELNIAVGASVYRQSKAFASTENLPVFLINSDATLVNGQLQFIMPERGLTLGFWGKNLTNETYTSGGYQNGSVAFNFFNAPRTYGASLTKRF
jgi:iron complex outermembrane receptor protein